MNEDITEAEFEEINEDDQTHSKLEQAKDDIEEMKEKLSVDEIKDLLTNWQMPIRQTKLRLTKKITTKSQRSRKRKLAKSARKRNRK